MYYTICGRTIVQLSYEIPRLLVLSLSLPLWFILFTSLSLGYSRTRNTISSIVKIWFSTENASNVKHCFVSCANGGVKLVVLCRFRKLFLWLNAVLQYQSTRIKCVCVCVRERCDPSVVMFSRDANHNNEFTIFNECTIINLCMELFRLQWHNLKYDAALCCVVLCSVVNSNAKPMSIHSISPDEHCNLTGKSRVQSYVFIAYSLLQNSFNQLLNNIKIGQSVKY